MPHGLRLSLACVLDDTQHERRSVDFRLSLLASLSGANCQSASTLTARHLCNYKPRDAPGGPPQLGAPP